MLEQAGRDTASTTIHQVCKSQGSMVALQLHERKLPEQYGVHQTKQRLAA
jgi:hypothetical protein